MFALKHSAVINALWHTNGHNNIWSHESEKWNTSINIISWERKKTRSFIQYL